MVRVTKFLPTNGRWYVRYWLGGDPVDESARTKNETAAERYRIQREVEINAGIQPLRRAEVGALIELYLTSLPPRTSKSHAWNASSAFGLCRWMSLGI